MNRTCLSVKGILKQLFDDRSRTLNNFTGGDMIDDVF
jgi:hypothetical protein